MKPKKLTNQQPPRARQQPAPNQPQPQPGQELTDEQLQHVVGGIPGGPPILPSDPSSTDIIVIGG